MTLDRARAILGADCCHPEREDGDDPGPTHLVLPAERIVGERGARQSRRVCDGRAMIAPVIADGEIPTCDRCRRAAAAAQRVIEREAS